VLGSDPAPPRRSGPPRSRNVTGVLETSLCRGDVDRVPRRDLVETVEGYAKRLVRCPAMAASRVAPGAGCRHSGRVEHEITRARSFHDHVGWPRWPDVDDPDGLDLGRYARLAPGYRHLPKSVELVVLVDVRRNGRRLCSFRVMGLSELLSNCRRSCFLVQRVVIDVPTQLIRDEEQDHRACDEEERFRTDWAALLRAMVNGKTVGVAAPHRVAGSQSSGLMAHYHAGSARNAPEIRSRSVHEQAKPRVVETGLDAAFADDGAAHERREAVQ